MSDDIQLPADDDIERLVAADIQVAVPDDAPPFIPDEEPRFTTEGHQFPRWTWALVRDRRVVAITRTHNEAEHPFSLIEGAPAAPDVICGQKQVPETGTVVVNITGVEAWTRVDTLVDAYGNPKPEHGHHY